MSKILHITYSGAGGMTEAVLTLLECCQDDSPSHHLLFFGVDPLPESVRSRCLRVGLPFSLIQKRPGHDWPSQANMAALLHRLQPDLVFSHMTQPLPALLHHKLTHPRCRLVSIEHHSNALKSPQDWLLTLANHHLTDHSVYLTPQYRRQLQDRLGPLLRSRKASVIPNGIDTLKFAPAPQTPPCPPFLVGMTGRMVPGKDFATLLQAFQHLTSQLSCPEIRLQLAGDGPLLDSHVSLSRELGISGSVDFLGHLTQEQLIPLMRSWHVFVLSTLGETMSRSIMEAQSLGLPIVATQVPGVTSSIAPGSDGLLVPPGDPREMSRAILQLLSSQEERRMLSQKARARALRDYSAGDSWRRYLSLADSLLSH